MNFPAKRKVGNFAVDRKSKADFVIPEAPETGAIRDDRELLERLGLNDAEAVIFLTKTRQALVQQLGPKGGGAATAPRPFRLGELSLLIGGAHQLERQIDVPAVKHYVATTRSEDIGSPAFAMLMRLLEGQSEEIQFDEVDTVVFLLPAFADMRTSRGDVAMQLLHLAHALPHREPAPAIFLLSSTEMQARMAGQWLGIDTGNNCFGRDLVDHYLPTVLLYRRRTDEARPYVLTEQGKFEAAPKFRSNMIADCVRSMMPVEMRKHLEPGLHKVDI